MSLDYEALRKMAKKKAEEEISVLYRDVYSSAAREHKQRLEAKYYAEYTIPPKRCCTC